MHLEQPNSLPHFPTNPHQHGISVVQSQAKKNMLGCKDLKDKVLSNFQPMWKYTSNFIDLQLLRQGPNESLEDFTEQFNNETMKIPGLSDQ